MFKLFNNQELMSPEDSGGVITPLTKGAILDKLNSHDSEDDTDPNALKLPDDESEDEEADVDDAKGEKEVPDEEDEEEKEEDELKEIEEELKEPDKEQLELDTPVQKREILAKYPTIFKDFPSLEKAYYRELAFTRVFPTIDDAKEAATAVATLNNFEQDLLKGNTVDLLKSVLETDKNAFAKIADTYMQNLAQVDERAYHHVLGNITKDIVKAMVNSGKASESKELMDAATTVYEFMFGTKEWKPKQNLAIDETKESNDERAKLQKERDDFETKKLTERQTDIMSGVDNRIKSVIDSNIDKKTQMTPFIKKNAIKEVKEKLDSLLKADTRFQSIVQQLWKKAKESNFSRDILDKIESAHVSKAKSLLPTIILSVKREALKGNIISRTKTKNNKDDEIKDEINENRVRNSTPPRNNGGPNDDFRNKPKPGESSLDFLTRRAK